jgi:hypothetical protein
MKPVEWGENAFEVLFIETYSVVLDENAVPGRSRTGAAGRAALAKSVCRARPKIGTKLKRPRPIEVRGLTATEYIRSCGLIENEGFASLFVEINQEFPGEQGGDALPQKSS